jgi:photosystem II stability/assembly factor-like uncharacterized protein
MKRATVARVIVAAAGCLILALVAACDTRASRFQLQRVVGPTGGNVLTVVVEPGGGEVIAPTEFGLFEWDGEGGWERIVGNGAFSELAIEDPFRGLLIDGKRLNYPRSRLFVSWQEDLWMVTPSVDGARLLHSDADRDGRWSFVELPGPFQKESEDETAPPRPRGPFRAAEPPRLVTTPENLYVVGTTDIWRMTGDSDAPGWESIGLGGLPTESEGLPPAIRNYLPAGDGREFEIVTVLSDQLMVFRRAEPEGEWVMTATLTAVDRELVGIPGTDSLFIVAPDSIQRSDDQGERWLGFWREDQPRIETMAVVPRKELETGYAMIVGATDGSIWVSEDGGGSWDETREKDPDRRAVSGLDVSPDGRVVWAATMGSGVVRSDDGGATWKPVNEELRAARALDVAFTNDGDLLIASLAGLHRMAGEPDSGNWAPLNARATTALFVEPTTNRTVSGTASGDLTLQAEDAEPVTIEEPFGEEPTFEFVPRSLSRAIIDRISVVDIAARDDGQRWMAWSRSHGAAVSDNGGVSWEPIMLPDALENALATTTVTQFIVDPGDTIYLVEESADSRTPALLWRSRDNGQSWTTVHAVPREEARRVIVKPRPPNFPGVLFSAHGDNFARSTDAGESWMPIEGPWDENRIVDFAVRGDRAALLVDARRRYEVVIVDDVDANAPIIERHVVRFPDVDTLPEFDDITNFALYERRVVLVSRDRMWIGTLPERRQSITDGMALLATIAASVVLIAATFVFMRAKLIG